MNISTIHKILILFLGVFVGFLFGHVYRSLEDDPALFYFGQKVSNGYCTGYVGGHTFQAGSIQFYKLYDVECTNGSKWEYAHERANALIPIN